MTQLEIALGVATLVLPPACAWFAARHGAEKGMAIGIAVHAEKLAHLDREVTSLRAAKHDHAGFLTRHEMDLAHIKNKLGLGS